MDAALSPAVLAQIASPRRQELLRLTWAAERSAGELHRAMPDVTFGAVSQQLRSLVEAGLLTQRAEHRHRYYRAVPDALGPLKDTLERMWDTALWRLKLAAELEQARRGPRPKPARRVRKPQSRNPQSRNPQSTIQNPKSKRSAR
jgi:DNA-binding transcriptional ArsR family regulator